MAGGGTALSERHPAVGEAFYAETEGDEKTGLQIVARALTAPREADRRAANAGIDGSVVLEKIRESPARATVSTPTLRSTGIIPTGIVDPTKVARSALENSASILPLLS